MAKSTPEPTSTVIYSIRQRNYALEPSCDIGEFIKSVGIQPFERIRLTLKPGNYMWEQNVIIPEGSNLEIIGEGGKNGGTENKVSISMTRKDEYEYNETKYANNARLMIERDATANIHYVDITEAINDTRTKSPCPSQRGVFNLIGDNSRLLLYQGKFEFTTSPFVNVGGWVYGRVLFGHSFFTRIGADSGVPPIQIISVETGWNFAGSKAIVSCSHTHVGPGCALGGENVELIR